MKRYFLFLVFIPFLLSKICFGDIIIGPVHYVEKCVKITNIEDYPDVALIGFTSSGSRGINPYVISPSTCLTSGYKYNDFNVFAVNKSYLEGKDIKKIDFPKDPNALISNIIIAPYKGFVHDTIHIYRIEQFYKIVGFSDSSVILFQWKEITRYTDGRMDLTRTLNYEGDASQFSQKITVGINSSTKHY